MVNEKSMMRKLLERMRERTREREYAEAVAKVTACFDLPLGGVR